MANDCRVSLQAVAIRVARLYASGVPAQGSNNLYVSRGFTEMVSTPVLDTGDEFKTKAADGALCVNYKDCDRLQRLDLTLDLCVLDPELMEILLNSSASTLDPGNGGSGFAAPIVGDPDCPTGVSVELWTKRIDDSGALDAELPYEWWAFPRTFWQLGPKTFNNGPMSHPLTGFANENPNWYDGPNNDWPVASDRVFQHVDWDSFPTPTCGYQTLIAS